MTWREVRDSILKGASWVSEFESQNVEAFEFLKWRGAQAVALLVGLITALSLTKSASFAFLRNYATGVVIAAIVLVILWFLEAIKNRVELPSASE